MEVHGHGITARLPAGWEASLRAAPAPLPARDSDREGDPRVAVAPPRLAVLHAATFPLPADRGDFGSGAVDRMGHQDTFVALLEYLPEDHGALFAAAGLPRRLDPRRFHGRGLQRALPGQAGWQHFFHVGQRPFCLYVVLGDRADAHRQVRRAERVLAGITIGGRA